jgi:hypothetical protein
MVTVSKKVLFNRNGCLSRYGVHVCTVNKISPEEKAMVEEHLKRCALCSEAVRGYKGFRQPVFLKNDLHFLSEKIRKRYRREEKAQKRSFLFIAFVVVSIAVIAVIIYLLYRLYDVKY